VFLLVVFDLLGAVRHVLLDRGVDVHLLGNGMAHHLGDYGVGQLPALAGIRRALDAAEQFKHFPVVGGEDVDDILAWLSSMGLGHWVPLLWVVVP
jgi:hypothetical protein